MVVQSPSVHHHVKSSYVYQDCASDEPRIAHLLLEDGFGAWTARDCKVGKVPSEAYERCVSI